MSRRPFRGLRREAPRPRYDAVVVGAGIGGLVTANLLVREGLSVLLVEQHYMVGGYCSTFRRAGYTFDAATHFYPLLGNAETITGRLLGELGVETGWVKMDPVDTFHFPDGSRFEVPADYDDYRERLDEMFPAERDNLERFFSEVQEAYMLGLLAYFRGRDTTRLDRFRDLSVRDALDRHFTDEKLKLLLTADCPHWGSAPRDTSFVFDSMLRLSYFLGNYYPVGGSQAFADDLARCFEEAGGDVLMSTRVRRIRVEAGRVAGVDMETLRGPAKGAKSVAAETVVSNADLRLTVDELVGEEHLGADYAAAVRRLRPSFPCFLSHVGLEGVEEADLERAQGYYWRHWDPDRVGRDGLICKIFSPTIYEPAMAPEGRQIVILQKVLEMDYEAVDDWAAHKAAIERQASEQLERAIPGVAERIVVQTSASALTSHRFTLNLHGAMLGWEMSTDQLGEERPGVETPVEGLWLVGHWTRPGGGITPVIVSACWVAEAITGRRLLRSGGATTALGRRARRSVAVEGAGR
ncbi:MAG TPA: NAD(P)/FAD-dependent oxidoreductase [Thermoanaerobaculia bacterium]|nr:NAD(P)/FAD-dependent oxidoreductase [Thermoanaerobaculia bacterium]